MIIGIPIESLVAETVRRKTLGKKVMQGLHKHKLLALQFLKFSGVSIIVSSGFVFSSSAQNKVLGFESWKDIQIKDAQIQLEKCKEQCRDAADCSVESGKAPLKSDKEGSRASLPQCHLEKLNIEVADDLSVHDYFVLYLTKVKGGRPAYIEISRNLKPEDVADLLMAYRQHTTTDLSREPSAGRTPLPVSMGDTESVDLGEASSVGGGGLSPGSITEPEAGSALPKKPSAGFRRVGTSLNN